MKECFSLMVCCCFVFLSISPVAADESIQDELTNTLEAKKNKFTEEVKQAKKDGDLLQGFAKYKYTTFYLNPIEKHVNATGSTGVEVADIETDSINLLTGGVILFPKTYHLTLSYTQSIKGGAHANRAGSGKQNEGVEQLTLSLRPLKNLEIVYDRYRLNSYISVHPGETVLFVDARNQTAETGALRMTDAGLDVLGGGDTASFVVEKERLDLRYLASDWNLFGSKYFVGAYYEKFQKPWSSGFEVWFSSAGWIPGSDLNAFLADNSRKIAVVYSEATFNSYGLNIGVKKSFRDFENGFNLQNLALSLGYVDIELTDNYSLSDKMSTQDAKEAIKATFSAELAYKHQFSEKKIGIASCFVNYDYYYIDLERTDTTVDFSGDYANHLKGDDLSLGDDFTYGFSVSLLF